METKVCNEILTTLIFQIGLYPKTKQNLVVSGKKKKMKTHYSWKTRIFLFRLSFLCGQAQTSVPVDNEIQNEYLTNISTNK